MYTMRPMSSIGYLYSVRHKLHKEITGRQNDKATPTHLNRIIGQSTASNDRTQLTDAVLCPPSCAESRRRSVCRHVGESRHSSFSAHSVHCVSHSVAGNRQLGAGPCVVFSPRLIHFFDTEISGRIARAA